MKVRWQFYVEGEKKEQFETNEQTEPPVGQWVRDADSVILYRVDRVTRILCPRKKQTVGVEVVCQAYSNLHEEVIHDEFDHQTKKIGSW